MKINVLGSGSSGNCYLAEIGGTKLLLECGLPYRQIQKALDYNTHEIEACFVTHEHLDHARSVKDLVFNGIDVYMTKGTKDALGLKGSHRLITLEKNNMYRVQWINNLLIKPFEIVHDAKEPVGFYIMDRRTKEDLIFITDTAYILHKLPPTNYLMVECNYVESVLAEELEEGKINLSLRNRIVRNHLSLERLVGFLEDYDLSKTKAIYLLHLSNNNSDKQMIYETVAKLTGKPVYFS